MFNLNTTITIDVPCVYFTRRVKYDSVTYSLSYLPEKIVLL